MVGACLVVVNVSYTSTVRLHVTRTVRSHMASRNVHDYRDPLGVEYWRHGWKVSQRTGNSGESFEDRPSAYVFGLCDLWPNCQIRGATASRKTLFSLSVYLTTLGCATPTPLPTFSDLSAGPVIEEGCSVASSIDFRKRCSNLRGTGRSWIDSSNLCAFLYHSPFLLRSRERTEMGRSNCCSIAQR